MAVLVDAAPQVGACAIDGRIDLIEVPPVARSGTPAAQLVGVGLPALAAPLADGLIRDDHSTFEEELFDIALAQAEAVVQPDTMADDLGRKLMVFIQVCWCGGVHSSSQDGLLV